MASNRPLFRPVTLFVMELEVTLSSKIGEKKQKGWEGGTTVLRAKGTFLFQFSRKYVGVAYDSGPAGNSHVLGSTFFPPVYFNRSYCKHMFII